MIVVSKKKVIVILIIFMIPFCLISMINDTSAGEVLEVSSLPISNHVIVVDAGHGNPDGGAVGIDGVSEAEINLKIALNLQKLLEQSGSVVILTRSDENGIYDEESQTIREKKVSDMKNRVEIGNFSDAEIFVSIHLNKIEESKYSGFQTFYQENNEDSKMLAGFIQDNLNYAIQKERKRKIMSLSGKYIMDNVKIPTVIIECGFLSNLEELNLLQNEDYQQKLAWGIYTGIMDYFYE